jgi:hypothetical protein
MNSVILSGEIRGSVKMMTDRKRHRPMCSFFVAAPFEHPHTDFSEDYRACMRTHAYGEDAEWARDTLYDGAHIEITDASVHTIWTNKMSFYNIEAYKIDKERSGEEPLDCEGKNIGRFGGYFRSMFDCRPAYDGVEKIGMSVAIAPTTSFIGSKKYNFVSFLLYDEHARMISKLKAGDKIDFLEGPLQPKGTRNRYGVYVNVTDLKI